MKAGLKAVIDALDASASPVDFFIRDDDAGWDDERLFALLRCTERARVPIDLALIPQATGSALAAELSACFDAAGGMIGLHQHGHAHSNFETAGRKCEFGPTRDLQAQRRDLVAGREHLRTLFGARLDAFFTPPWNRCSVATPSLLAELGYAGLSRDRTAFAQQALPELRVDLDWCKQWRLATERGEGTGDAIAFELARHVQSGATVGLMLHHAQMSDTELQWLQAWLSACFDAAGGLIGLHQHGHAHSNFETAGRKCEFGPTRDLQAQRRDLIAGRERLRTLFGARLDAFFTPPWNRCSVATPSLLADLGYAGLSRDRTAFAQHALPELRVDVDWCRQWRLATERGEATGDAIAFELARHVQSGATVGLMLHHAQMSDTELQWLQTWLTAWARHPNARWRPMRELLGGPGHATAQTEDMT